MSAISAVLMGLCNAGDTVIMGDVVYGATEHLAQTILARMGITVVEVDTADLLAVERVVSEHPGARVLFFETPTNPMLAVTDIPAVARMARQANPEMKVVVDNTFATPYLQRPLSLGLE